MGSYHEFLEQSKQENKTRHRCYRCGKRKYIKFMKKLQLGKYREEFICKNENWCNVIEKRKLREKKAF